MTYKQAAELGAQVRKGEHGALVVFADRFTKTETDDRGEAVERQIPLMKGYAVFNVEQIDGLPAHYYATAAKPRAPVARIEHAEAFFAATGATIRHGGNRAFYAPSRGFVQMPPRESFKDAESYCATLAHELTHWTAHPSRCARELGKCFGDRAMPPRNSLPKWARPSCAPISASPWKCATTTVSRSLVERSQERQPGDLHRRRPCAARRRSPAWPATNA